MLDSEIALKRSAIIARMVQSCDVDPDDCDSILERCDLGRLFFLYDEIFFDDKITEELGWKKPSIEFVDKGSRSAGTANLLTHSIELNIRCFRNFYAVKREITVNGVVPESVFEAVLLVFEHELGHLICSRKYHDSGHGQYFKLFTKRTFGHTDCRHTLPQKGEIRLKAMNDDTVVIPDPHRFEKGDRVRFPYRSGYLEGIIINIRKRAVIEIENPLTDMPTKYYVPLAYLIKVLK